MPQTIELPDVIASAFDAALQGVWTASPGIVQSYDATNQTANIQVSVKNVSVGEDGGRVVETVATLNAVPVIHAGGAGFRAVFPPAAGDTALVVFCSRAIARWLMQGGVVDPGTNHHHDLSDGVAIVGLRSRKNKLANSPSDHPSIGHDAGATIEFRQNEIRLGGDTGTQPTFKGELSSALLTMFQAIQTAISGIPSGGSAAAATLSAPIIQFVVDADLAKTLIVKVK